MIIAGGVSLALGVAVVATVQPVPTVLEMLAFQTAMLGLYRFVDGRWIIGGLSTVLGLVWVWPMPGSIAGLSVLFSAVLGVAMAVVQPRVPVQLGGLAALVGGALAIAGWQTPELVAWVLGLVMVVQGALLPAEEIGRR